MFERFARYRGTPIGIDARGGVRLANETPSTLSKALAILASTLPKRAAPNRRPKRAAMAVEVREQMRIAGESRIYVERVS